MALLTDRSGMTIAVYHKTTTKEAFLLQLPYARQTTGNKCKCSFTIFSLPDTHFCIYTTLARIANFSMKYFILILGKVYMMMVVHSLYACTGDNPLALARGLSPRTGGQTIV